MVATSSSGAGKGGAGSGKGGGGQAAGGAGGGNVYNQSSNAFNQAGNLLGASAQQYMGAQLGNASLAKAAQMADPKAISAGINQYMNPYENNVINRASTDVNRLVAQQDASTAAGAANSGAFGGSRHGIVQALTRSEGQKNLGDMAANLRHQGFTTAAGLSQQDIANKMSSGQFNAGAQQQVNLANQAALNQRGVDKANFAIQRGQGLSGLSAGAQGLGQNLFGVGQQLNQDQMGAGALQQQLLQGILSGAQGQYQQFMGQPQNLLNMHLGALGMNPLNNATTTVGQYKPGMLDYAGLAAQGLGAWRMGS